MLFNTGVLEEFLEDYHKETYGHEIAKKLRQNQKTISLKLKKLEEQKILTSRIIGKTTLYKLNQENENVKDFLVVAEINKKMKFLEEHQVIKELTKNLEGIIGIFGSYTKKENKESSDIDIFIINGSGKKILEKAKKFEFPIDVKKFTEKEFKNLLKNKDSLISEIVENHVLINGAEPFVNYLWKHYYGFN